MTNACGCFDHSRLNEVLHEYHPGADATLLADRRSTHVLHLDAADGPLHLKLTTGALMGETSAPDEFRMDLAEPVNAWRYRSPQPELQA
eukprot:8382362-Pyramimonas_sp.AAC.1